LRWGAEDYLVKPLDPYELKSRVSRILERKDLTDHLAHLQSALYQRYSLASVVQNSSGMKHVVQRISQVAPTGSTVLILGESGVGKELVAKAIHFNSPRRHRPFLAINCAAIPTSLIESELFGHERGAFTGAVERARGKFEMAEGGTLFLDEVGEMDLQTQVKLLRVIEEREFMRVGGTRNIRIDVRVLAATNSVLQEKIRQGRFREDLYFRLQVITFRVPPLRERVEDVPELARIFLGGLCRENRLPPREISSEALLLLQEYAWPGNVREPGCDLAGVRDRGARSSPACAWRAGAGGIPTPGGGGYDLEGNGTGPDPEDAGPNGGESHQGSPNPGNRSSNPSAENPGIRPDLAEPPPPESAQSRSTSA
jgi:DNA-binding NtrC family response regulator